MWEEVRSSLLDRLQPAFRKHCWGFSRLGPGFPFPPRGQSPACAGGVRFCCEVRVASAVSLFTSH